MAMMNKKALGLAVCFPLLFFAGCASLPEAENLLALSGGEASAEEKVFLASYMKNLRYRVYYKEDSSEEPSLKDAVLRSAWKCVLSRGAALTEEIKEEDAVAGIEIDTQSEGESREENHYGSVRVRCTVIEPFSGIVLNSVERSAPRTFSKASQFDAKANAAQIVLSEMIPEVVEQTKRLLVVLYEKGLLYELVVRRMPNSGKTEDFRKALAVRVRTLRIMEDSPGETRYTFAFSGLPEDAEKAVYEAAREAGAKNMESAGRRERRLVFDFR